MKANGLKNRDMVVVSSSGLMARSMMGNG